MKSDYFLQQKALVKKLEKSVAKNNYKSTIVDVQKNYINDNQICLTSVVFIPKKISEKIIKKIINPLGKIEPEHYFYPIKSLHLTIKNVKTIHWPPLFTQSDTQKVKKLFKEIIPKFKSFDFYVEDVVLFPTSISVMAYSNNKLQKLVFALNNGLNKIGVPDDKKYFSNFVFWGNITICRFVKPPRRKFINAVKKMRNLKFGKFKVKNINLITCNAVCNPKTRKIIAEYKLKYESRNPKTK